MAEWFSMPVGDLSVHPLQCYLCLRYGHVRSNCRSEVHRGGKCFAFGVTSHSGRECTPKLNCHCAPTWVAWPHIFWEAGRVIILYKIQEKREHPTLDRALTGNMELQIRKLFA